MLTDWILNISVKTVVTVFILLFISSCNVSKKTNSSSSIKNIDNKEQRNITMEEKEQQVFNIIKDAGTFGISAQNISEKINLPVNEVKNILIILDNKNLVEKIKADCRKKDKKGNYVRFGCLIYNAK